MKKTIAILTAALLLVSVLAGVALGTEDEAARTAYYLPVTGEITAVNEYYDKDGNPVEGWFFLSVALENEGEAVIFITDETCYPFSNETAVGDVVTGYFRANMPMIMIYPPRYSVDVLVTSIPEEQSIKVDRFTSRDEGPDGYLYSDDGMLAVKLDEDTEVFTQTGEPFDGELDGRSLAVVYDVSTRSIPAQTTPLTVYVLNEPNMSVEDGADAEIPLPFDIESCPIIVNGEEIPAPPAMLADGDIVMVPVRAIAEALGFIVTWDGDTRTVTLGSDITLSIGSTSCAGAGDKDVLLAAAPVIVDDRTFVPLHFFKDAAGMNNAYVFEGQIVIDRDGEIMN